MQILPQWMAVLAKNNSWNNFLHLCWEKEKSASFQIHRTSKRAKNIHFDIYSFYKAYFHFILVDFNAIVVRAKTNWPSRKQTQCQTNMIFLRKVSKFTEGNGQSRLCHLHQQERNTIIKLRFVLFKQLFECNCSETICIVKTIPDNILSPDSKVTFWL